VTEPSPILLLNQTCQPATIPKRGDAREAARLRAALTWAYEYVVYHYDESYGFTSAVYYNGQPLDLDRYSDRVLFEVTGDAGESETNLQARAIGPGSSMEFIRIVPMNSADQPIDFSIVDESSVQRTLRYATDTQAHYLKVSIAGLNVLQTDTAQACIEVKGGRPVCFSTPLAALLERRDSPASEIRIDELNDQQTGQRRLEDYLGELFSLFFEGVSASTLDIRCDYSYPLAAPDAQASIPLMALARRRYALSEKDSLVQAIATQLKNFFAEMMPAPHGTLIFRVQVYREDETLTTPGLALDALLLPADSVADIG
jgi:hypothetical protein